MAKTKTKEQKCQNCGTELDIFPWTQCPNCGAVTHFKKKPNGRIGQAICHPNGCHLVPKGKVRLSK